MSKQRAGEVARAAGAAVWRVKFELLEVVFLAAFVVGVFLIYAPAGWMVGGVLGVLWCERADAELKRKTTKRLSALGERRAA